MPAMYWRVDLLRDRAEVIRRCGELQFETILVDPPWAEYAARAPGAGLRTLTLAELRTLPVQALARLARRPEIWSILLLS